MIIDRNQNIRQQLVWARFLVCHCWLGIPELVVRFQSWNVGYDDTIGKTLQREANCHLLSNQQVWDQYIIYSYIILSY